MGLSRPNAASGIAATLWAKAQNRLVLIVRRVARDSRIAVAAPRRSSLTKVMSEAPIATSVPAPIAMPRSAWANAAASVHPVADHRYHFAAGLQLGDGGDLVGGHDVGDDLVDTDLLADRAGDGPVVAGEQDGESRAR